MREKTVTIEIDEQGNSSIDLEGFQGQGCAEVAKAFQGSDTVSVTRNKREFYAQASVVKASQKQA
ncbi:MAG: hypothetical protein IPJ98_00415 [Bryobacterales bacterium]|nr:hypothetical protein [Bryobacterales bacterium]